MARDPAAVKRQSGVDERKMNGVAHQVIDDKRVPCDAQRFTGKTVNVAGSEMVGEKRASHNVKAVVAKGKGQSVSADSGKLVREVEWRAVEYKRASVDPVRKKGSGSRERYIAGSARHIEPVQTAEVSLLHHCAEQFPHGAGATEDAVKEPQIGQRAFHFPWCSRITVQQLGNDLSLHSLFD